MGNLDRDYSIDFIKGVAALSVVLLHNMPNYHIGSILWIGQAVPLFLMITAYLTSTSFEKGKTLQSYYSKNSILKMLNRVFKPFLIVLFFQCLLFFFIDPEFSIKGVIASGGIGPGSYYPWIYLQVWMVLPIVILIVDRMPFYSSCILFISLCMMLEFTSSLVHPPEFLYRLTFYRYLFLLYLACVMQKKAVRLNLILIVLAAISMTFLILMTYLDLNLEPLFFHTNWRAQSWPAYFYTVFFFLLLTTVYKRYPINKITRFFIQLGNYSYEVFLCQMVVFSFVTLKMFSWIENIYLENVAFIAITTILSVAPILFYKRYKKLFFAKSNDKLE